MTMVVQQSERSAAMLIDKMSRDAGHPLEAMIEVSDRCNEVCVHCYQVQGQKGEMTTEQVKNVINELADMGVLFLTFSGGEATLRRDFLELVAHARSKKFAVRLFTNGLTMTRELARALADLAVHKVEVSLYSPRAEVHDWVTRVPGSFEKSTNGVRYLTELGVRVILKSPLMSFNVGDYKHFMTLAVDLGADFMLDTNGLTAREDGYRGAQAFDMSDDEALAVKHDETLMPQPEGPPPERALDESPCTACVGAVHIEANGEMRPCQQLGVEVGHAVRDGIAQAWYGNETARALRGLTWEHIHGCRDCDLRAYCSRCYAEANVAAGDALAPYDAACRSARLHYAHVHGIVPRVLAPGDDAASTEVTHDESAPMLGPYRVESDGVLRQLEDVVTERDDELARALGWTRRSNGPVPEARRAAPGGLVQIRRPGRRREDTEHVPP